MPPFLIFLTYTKYSMSTWGANQGAKVHIEKVSKEREQAGKNKCINGEVQ